MYLYSNNAIFFILTIEVLLTVVFIIMQKSGYYKLVKESENIGNTQDKNLKVTLSIGIAVCPDDGDNFYELFKAADKALYKAKNSGKDCVCFV